MLVAGVAAVAMVVVGLRGFGGGCCPVERRVAVVEGQGCPGVERPDG